MTNTSGRLFVVATPIGNLGDISSRALDVLGAVDLILAEDTRHSAKLLGRFGISTKVTPFHEHNERRAVADILARIRSGLDVALISDAGTPLISDPGFHLVKIAHEQQIQVVPVPGPSAVLAALSVGGLPTDRFVFEGFLPSRREQRLRRLEALADVPSTIVILEGPHRLLSTLEDMVKVFGPERTATVAKEMTKVFEVVRRDTLGALHAWLTESAERQKGEFVLLIAGAVEAPAEASESTHRVLLSTLMDEVPLKTAVKMAVKLSAANRNDLYELALEIARERGEES
jgi:16S rRNA (cytidine1402-2'-O)-methyltransferase